MTFSEWPFPSRNLKSLITSWPQKPTKNSEKKSSRLSQSRSRPKPVKEPDSSPTSLLEMEKDTLDWDGSVTRKSKELSRELLKLLSLTLFQSEKDIGVTLSELHTLFQPRFTENVVQSDVD